MRGGNFSRVGASGTVKKHFNDPQLQGIPVTKNGYIFVYVSNESNLNVFFDNLQVIHKPGPIVEETHYYPFGLTMAGISSKAAGSLINKKGYNGNELQSKEFSDGSGLEMYDFNARTYDQQIGRFIQIDPLLEEEGQETISPYHFSYNNPIRFNDPYGEAPDDLIIRGQNNSSVTIVTNLIDIDVNASSLGVDFGGSYTLQGDDLLGAALDIVGVFDPTGIADGINAKLAADKGNWGDAIISGFGVIPYLGDVAKVGKIGKDVKIIKEAVQAVNGNSKASSKAQHVYEVFEKGTGKVVKTGVSGGKVSKADKSYRATSQANKWNKAEGAGKYDSRIVNKIPAGKGARQKALNAEKKNAKKLQKEGHLQDPDKHKTPR